MDSNPNLVPPSHLTMVNDNLYKCIIPEQINLPFLKTLRLNTILVLCPESCPDVMTTFCKEEGIQLVYVDTEEYDIDSIPSKEEKKRVIEILLNGDLYPLLFCGNKDSKIPGVYVMLLRYIQRCSSSFIYKEFKKYGDKLDDDLKTVFDDIRIDIPSKLPPWITISQINPLVIMK